MFQYILTNFYWHQKIIKNSWNFVYFQAERAEQCRAPFVLTNFSDQKCILPPQWQHCMQKEQKSVLLTPFSLSFFQNYKSDKFTIEKALSKMMILIVSYRSHFWDKDDIFLWKFVTFQFFVVSCFHCYVSCYIKDVTQLSFLIFTIFTYVQVIL